MNINQLSEKIIYKELEKANEHDFFYLIYDNQQYLCNDLKFIEHFKNRGCIFWYLVILCTDIPIKDLAIKYFDYFVNDAVLEKLNGEKKQINLHMKYGLRFNNFKYYEKHLKNINEVEKLKNEYNNYY